MKIQLYKGLKNVPDAVFNNLIPTDSFYFSKSFLASFEDNNPLIECSYLVASITSGVVGFAIIQQLEVDLEVAAAQLPLHKQVAKSLHCYIANRTTTIAICGNVFLSGNYGVYIKEQLNAPAIYKAIAAAIKSSAIGSKASVYFFKDFNPTDQEHAAVLTSMKYQPFPVEPNMILHIANDWNTFESYKAAFKSKYRVKANKADSMSNGVIVKSLKASDILTYHNQLQHLLNNTTDRALVKTVDLNIATYASLKAAFPEHVLLNGYFLENELVGFAVAFINNSTIDAHFIGMNYSVNKQLSLYPRILNDYVRLAINHKAKTLNLGRTSSEIKSTLGAKPEVLVCYLRHKRTVANLVFKPLIKQLELTSYKQHEPFKN